MDEFLRGRSIDRLECGRTLMEVSEELGVSSPGFGNDSKMMEMSVNVTVQVATELLRQMKTSICQ